MASGCGFSARNFKGSNWLHIRCQRLKVKWQGFSIGVFEVRQLVVRRFGALRYMLWCDPWASDKKPGNY
jgi:hypothetical protein